MNDQIVITGIGLLSPIGDKFDAFIDCLLESKTGIRPITLFDTSNFQTKLAAEISDFDPLKYLEKKGLRYMDRSTKLLLSASKLAIEDSAYTIHEENENLGVVVGNTFGSLHSISNFDKTAIVEGVSYVSPSDFANCVKNSPASNVSIKFHAMCMNVTISNGFSSTLDAFGYAYDMLRLKNAEVLIVGGVEEFCEQILYGFEKNGLLNDSNSIEQLRLPFDTKSHGMVLGEGSGMFILEHKENAEKRPAKIYGTVAGFGRCFNYNDNFIDAMVNSMNSAIESSGMKPNDIDVIIANANGDPELDKNELQAISNVFCSNEIIHVTSIKGNVGECYSAGGAFQVAAALGMIQRQELIPAYGCVDSPECPSNVKIVKHKERKCIRNVLVCSFGLSGFNTSVVISK